MVVSRVFQSSSSTSAADAALAAKLQAEEDAVLAQRLEDERLAMAHDVSDEQWDPRSHALPTCEYTWRRVGVLSSCFALPVDSASLSVCSLGSKLRPNGITP